MLPPALCYPRSLAFHSPLYLNDEAGMCPGCVLPAGTEGASGFALFVDVLSTHREVTAGAVPKGTHMTVPWGKARAVAY